MSARPDYTGIGAIPAISEITKHLDQGMRPKSYAPWQMVVSCEEHLARKPMDGYAGVVVHLPMRDEDDFQIPERSIVAAVRAAEAVMIRKGRVLVHCTGGLNRSGLVVARILIDVYDMHPEEAVRHMRLARDKFVLCNRSFERWVLGEELPTAETSAFAADEGTGQ